MAPPEKKGGAKAVAWVSQNSAKDKNMYYYNRGLMSLLDILYTPELYMMKQGPGVTKFPNWKRGNYIKSKTKKRQTDYADFFEILNNVCKLMENFILYQVKDSIEWERDRTWPMRQWMTHIAHALSASGARLQEKTRASLDMTPDISMDSAASLSARLRRSLRVSLPVLDSSVLDYMKENGFDHIRDADLYLRLVGVTNFLALQQLARTHEALLVGNEYHARVFNGLPLGTQSEMKLMFQRIVIKPSAAFDVMASLDITVDIENTVEYPNKVTYSLARDCIRNIIEATIVAIYPGMSIAKWKSEHSIANTIHNYVLDNADYFMTHGIYSLARLWPPHNFNVTLK